MPNSTRFAFAPPALGWLLLALAIAFTLIVRFKDPGYYPSLRVQTGAGVDIVFLNQSRTSRTACESVLDRIEHSTRRHCPTCLTLARHCDAELPETSALYFSDRPAPLPSAHMPSGVMVFDSPDLASAQQVCQATAALVNQGSAQARAECFAAQSARPFFKLKSGPVQWRQIGFALLGFVVAWVISRYLAWLILRFDHLHRRFSHDENGSGPQKFHALPTPRIGGLPVIIGLVCSTTVLLTLPNHFSDQDFLLLLFAALPAFLGGLAEDLTKKVGVPQRLVLTILSGLVGCWMLGATLTRLDLPLIDELLKWAPFAIAFTAFAVGGVANSVNIIDGYNGLAAGFGLIASAALAIVAARYGDALLVFANLAMAGALTGFLTWNWPRGRIFLGDGGAYLLGFWLAEMNVMLITRNPDVSPWLPMAVMIYPVFETLFTIYRRTFKHKTSPGQPDSMHLHQMIYKRLVRIHIGTANPTLKTRRNSRVAPYLWVLSAACSAVAIFFASETAALQFLCLGFCTFYIALYRRLTGWRVPRLLRLRSDPGTGRM